MLRLDCSAPKEPQSLQPQALESALDKLLTIKADLDADLPSERYFDRWLIRTMFQSGMLARGWNDRERGEPKVIDGAFVEAALPFCDPCYSTTRATVARVNARRVLGGRYRGVPDLPDDALNTVADELDRQSRDDLPEAAHYVQIGDFSLFVASEGKNRVSLYRALGREITARVYRSPYPSPADLELVRISPGNQYGLRYLGTNPAVARRLSPWQILSGGPNPIAVLPFGPSVSILEAYGVETSKQRVFSPRFWQSRQALLYVSRSYYTR